MDLILNGKKIVEVYISTGDFNFIGDKNKFLESLITKEIEYKLEYLGFEDKGEFKDFIRDFVVGVYEKDYTKEINFDVGEIKKIILEVFEKCFDVLGEDIIKIFIFPTFDKFSINMMGGSNGFCVFKNTMIIGLNPLENWKTAFKETIIHELAHALSSYYDMGTMTLGQGFIFDGLAEHFRESMIGGKKAPWVNKISKKDSLKILNELKDKLNDDNLKLYSEVFYGTGKYPLWAGYTIGYYLVKDYLKKQKNIDWKKLLRKNPKEILKEIEGKAITSS